MAKNVVRDAGFPIYGTTKNVASAKISGDIIPFPLTQAAGNPVALLTADAAANADGVSCILGGVVVRATCVTTDTGDPGAQVYWDNTNFRFTTTASTHNKAGRLAKTKANGDTTADVYLNIP